MNERIHEVERPNGIRGKCKHFNGLTHDTCEAGVNYDEVSVGGEWKYRYRGGGPVYEHRMCHPCISRMNFAGVTCQHAEYPTDEDIAAWEADVQQRTANYIKARTAISEHSGDDRQSGSLTCPVCETGTLRYAIASNGHCHAACTTEGCVGWME